MHSSFHKSLLQEETRYKDDVYRYLDEEIQEAKENVAEKSAAVHRGRIRSSGCFCSAPGARWCVQKSKQKESFGSESLP